MSYNGRLGKHMRYCESCGVGIGIMTREEFVSKYMHSGGLCPTCNHKVIKPVQKVTVQPKSSIFDEIIMFLKSNGPSNSSEIAVALSRKYITKELYKFWKAKRINRFRMDGRFYYVWQST